VKDEHVKDAAQGVAQDVAEYVLGVAENGSVKELVLVIGVRAARALLTTPPPPAARLRR